MLFRFLYKVYTVRESQGEKGLFHLGQGKSGKLVMVGKNSIFILQVRERISFFIIKEVFRFFSLNFNFFPFAFS